ncbi:hypothetical protein PAMP_018009 [Pampus punctatissimus]
MRCTVTTSSHIVREEKKICGTSLKQNITLIVMEHVAMDIKKRQTCSKKRKAKGKKERSTVKMKQNLNKKSSSSFGVMCSIHKNTQQEKFKSTLKAALRLILEMD